MLNVFAPIPEMGHCQTFKTPSVRIQQYCSIVSACISFTFSQQNTLETSWRPVEAPLTAIFLLNP